MAATGWKRLHGKKLFLTYPQSDPLTRERLLTFIQEKCGKVKKYLICTELHEDGHNHLHAFFHLEKAVDYTSCHCLDVDGKHGNYQPAKSDFAVEQYVAKKGDNYITNYYQCSAWAAAIDLPTAEAKALLRERHPREMLMYGERIMENHSYMNKKAKVEYAAPHVHYPNITTDMMQWVVDELPKTDRAKMLLVKGPTRIGKTAWARSLGRHMYWKGMFNLDKWDDDATYMVVDDIEWKFVPYKKNILTCAGECELTDRYRHKKTVICNKPCIYLTNNWEDYGDVANEEYWRQNTTLVWMDDDAGKLF